VEDFFNTVLIFFKKAFSLMIFIGIIFLLYLMRNWFQKVYYFLEDTTTGFIKVRERLS